MMCFLCILRVFLEICINLKIKLKKASVNYIKKSILNTTQKKNFQKHYSFNRFVFQKLCVEKVIYPEVYLLRYYGKF